MIKSARGAVEETAMLLVFLVVFVVAAVVGAWSVDGSWLARLGFGGALLGVYWLFLLPSLGA